MAHLGTGKISTLGFRSECLHVCLSLSLSGYSSEVSALLSASIEMNDKNVALFNTLDVQTVLGDKMCMRTLSHSLIYYKHTVLYTHTQTHTGKTVTAGICEKAL